MTGLGLCVISTHFRPSPLPAAVGNEVARPATFSCARSPLGATGRSWHVQEGSDTYSRGDCPPLETIIIKGPAALCFPPACFSAPGPHRPEGHPRAHAQPSAVLSFLQWVGRPVFLAALAPSPGEPTALPHSDSHRQGQGGVPSLITFPKAPAPPLSAQPLPAPHLLLRPEG